MHTAYIQPPGAPPVKVCYIVTYKSCHILGALRTYRIFDETQTRMYTCSLHKASIVNLITRIMHNLATDLETDQIPLFLSLISISMTLLPMGF